MVGRGEVTEEAWSVIAPLLPARGRRGGQWRDHRRVIDGILWKLRTGAPWRDLPERYGPWRTVASRYYRWVHAGVWERVLAAVQEQGDRRGALDWELHHVDSTSIRAHQHAAGARRSKGGPRSKRSGGVEGASRPSSTCGPKAGGSHWSCC